MSRKIVSVEKKLQISGMCGSCNKYTCCLLCGLCCNAKMLNFIKTLNIDKLHDWNILISKEGCSDKKMFALNMPLILHFRTITSSRKQPSCVIFQNRAFIDKLQYMIAFWWALDFNRSIQFEFALCCVPICTLLCTRLDMIEYFLYKQFAYVKH